MNMKVLIECDWFRDCKIGISCWCDVAVVSDLVEMDIRVNFFRFSYKIYGKSQKLNPKKLTFCTKFWIFVPFIKWTAPNCTSKFKKFPFPPFQRAFILFFLGVCFNTIGGSSLKDIRIFGVLQKFGIAYLIVSLIYISLPSTSYDSIPVKSIKRHFLDITSIYKQWLVILFLIIIHMLIIFGISAPNCDLGYFGPGGIHDFGAHANCTGGIAGYIDRLLLGDSHLYQKANVMAVYAASLPFDPEGPFGSLLACVQVFLGVQCCMTILNYQKPAERLVRWIFWGLILLAVTAVLTSCSIDDGLIPINKNLWSLTFVTVTSALAFLLISLIYFLVDVKNIGDDCWTLFLYPGMNPIVIYIGHFVFHHMWPFRWNYEGMNTHFEFMIENFYNVVIWVLISHGMYYCNIFYKIWVESFF